MGVVRERVEKRGARIRFEHVEGHQQNLRPPMAARARKQPLGQLLHSLVYETRKQLRGKILLERSVGEFDFPTPRGLRIQERNPTGL